MVWHGRTLLPIFLAWLFTVGKKMVDGSNGYILEEMCGPRQFHSPTAVGLWAPYNPSVVHPSSTPHNCTCHLVVLFRSTAIVHVGHMRKPVHDDCRTHIQLNTKTWSRKVCATSAQNFTKHQLDFSTDGLWVSYHNPYADSEVTFVINIKGSGSNLESWVRCAIGNKVPSVSVPTTPSIIPIKTTEKKATFSTSKILKDKPTRRTGIRPGVVAGAVVSVVVVILLIIAAVTGFFIWKRYQLRKNIEEDEGDNAPSNQAYASLEEIILPGEDVGPSSGLQFSAGQSDAVQYSKAGHAAHRASDA